MSITRKPKTARITSPEEREPLYAAYAAGRARGEEIGFHCPDDSIIQYAIRAYDREKYGTEALGLPDWLVHLVRAAALMAEETECDEPGHDQGDDCDACAWDALYQAVPQRTKALVEQAHKLATDQGRVTTRG